MIDATDPQNRIDRDEYDEQRREEQRREEHGAEIDAVLMRLVHRVLQEAQEARDVQESGEPQDPAAPLDHMIDVLDDLIAARQELDHLYAAVYGATDGGRVTRDPDDLRAADDVHTLDAQDLDDLATLDADAPPSPETPHLPAAPPTTSI